MSLLISKDSFYNSLIVYLHVFQTLFHQKLYTCGWISVADICNEIQHWYEVSDGIVSVGVDGTDGTTSGNIFCDIGSQTSQSHLK